MRLVLTAAMIAALLALAGCDGPSGSSYTGLRVSANQLVIGPGAGRPVQLRGINRSGLEDRCVESRGFFDSPTPALPDSPAMIAAMRSWDVNVVRVPLNEGCWLGRGAPAAFSGAAYRRQVADYVHELNGAGLFVILSLQWLTVDGSSANLTPPMPDAALAPAFWRSVSETFHDDTSVLFDLYNEPFDVSWSCWRDGCTVPAGSAPSATGTTQRWGDYRAAGMQSLVDAIRGSGSRAPILASGLSYALDLSDWLADAPSDPDSALIASIHSYGGGASAVCDSGCESTVAAVAAHVPVLFGELGEADCASGYIDSIMSFADARGIGYLGWAWDATDSGGWSCNGGPALITDYGGTPTPYGAGLRDHLRARGQPVGPGAA